MGRLLIKASPQELQRLTTNDVLHLPEGKVRYTLFLNEEGGIKEDATLYRLSEKEFLLCVNASNREKMVNYLSQFVEVSDASRELAQIALQGPDSRRLLSRFFPVEDMKYYTFRKFGAFLVSRTGYTGEKVGYEVYGPPEELLFLVKELLKEATPCGLASRDLLRIEAGFPLYGNELSEEITPFEASLERFVKLERDFIGKEALLKRPIRRKLYGLELEDKGVPRRGQKVLREGKEVGEVSSGAFSPHLGKGIALCFLLPEERREGEAELFAGKRKLKARLRPYPFI